MSHTAIPQSAPPVSHRDEHVGRFDDGQELEPEKDREHVGRFDDGQELEPEQDREQVGRFDDEGAQG